MLDTFSYEIILEQKFSLMIKKLFHVIFQLSHLQKVLGVIKCMIKCHFFAPFLNDFQFHFYGHSSAFLGIL